MPKQRVAVFFGGRSPEHDVSIITGLQVMDALRSDLFESIPVYVSSNGEWFTGEALRDRQTYVPGPELRRKLTPCYLGHSVENRGVLVPARKGLFGSTAIEFDVALPAFHGAFGEDGSFQGLLETAGIAYTGMRVLASAIAMDKTATKVWVQSKTGAPQLPCLAVVKGVDSRINMPSLPSGWNYPVIVKPAHMGSSIGVARADSDAEVQALLRTIFLYDSKAMLEPYVANRREYNIAVKRTGQNIETSAIEMPKSTAELLDFKEKYVRGDGLKKTGGASQGMLSLTRDINPHLDAELEASIRRWAVEIFESLEGTGVPRLDFMLDTQSDQVWFNEINPCPGSFGHFLWEAAPKRVLFSELLEHLIDEAVTQRNLTDMPVDPVPEDARLFPRR